jgi:glycine/D-amino acid oxidase-like deaminating enzyme
MKESFAEEGDAEGVARYTLWTSEEVREKFSVKGTGSEGETLLGAVSYEAGSLNAYRFVIGLLKMCVKIGLSLFTNTPATLIEKTSSGLWHIQTPSGVLQAKRVVLATNGYTAFLQPQFQGCIVPLRGQVTAHRPGASMPPTGLETTYSFIYSNGYEYMIPRPLKTNHPGDIIIGGGLVKAPQEGLYEYGTTDDTAINPTISKYLRDTTLSYFGESWGTDDKAGRIRKEWTGIMGYSPDGYPFIGEVPGCEGLWIAASFQGHGMVLCWMCGQALVELMDATTEKVEELRKWFPNAFRVEKERLEKKFVGRLHTVPMDAEPQVVL